MVYFYPITGRYCRVRLISGIFAAAMSTLSGGMNSAATAYIVDIYSRFFHKGEGGNELHAARMATCVIGIISLSFAFLMATWNIASLWDEFNECSGSIVGGMEKLFMLGITYQTRQFRRSNHWYSRKYHRTIVCCQIPDAFHLLLCSIRLYLMFCHRLSGKLVL